MSRLGWDDFDVLGCSLATSSISRRRGRGTRTLTCPRYFQNSHHFLSFPEPPHPRPPERILVTLRNLPITSWSRARSHARHTLQLPTDTMSLSGTLFLHLSQIATGFSSSLVMIETRQAGMRSAHGRRNSP